MSLHTRWIAFALLGRLPCATAQELDANWYGDNQDDQFGTQVRFIGDVDGDGWVDMAASSYIQYGNPNYVRVFSGYSYAVIRTLYENAQGDQFGAGLGAVGDVDGDGFDDLLVTAPGDDTAGTNSGSASIYSGHDGSVLLRIDGTTADPLGFNACELGDIDGDGVKDFAVSGNAKVFVHSSKSGARLGTLTPTISGGRQFGFSLADAGDIDGDGTNDVIVGEPSCDSTYLDDGRAYVFSGKTGAVIYSYSSPPHHYDTGNALCFGFSVAGAGDVDRDGRDDFVVGVPFPITYVSHSTFGEAVVYSGRTGTKLFDLKDGNFWQQWNDTSEEGYSVAPAGDVNGDGYADIAVGDPLGHFWGGVEIYSGLNGARLTHIEGEVNAGVGFAIAGGLDLDRDGRQNVLTSDPYSPSGGMIGAGRVELRDFGGFFVDAVPRHPFPNDTIILQAAQTAPGQPGGIFLVGVNGAPTFSLLYFAKFDRLGTLSTYGIVPPGLSGASITLRAYALDPSNHLLVSGDTTVAFQ